MIKPGLQFWLSGEDFDASDVYRVLVKAADPDLVLDISLLDGDHETVVQTEEVTIPSSALQNANGLLKLSQGSFTGFFWDEAQKKREYVSSKPSDPGFVPSFFLTRAQLAELATKDGIDLQPLFDSPDVDHFTVVERSTRDFEIDGESVTQKVVTLQGKESGASITVLDDARWPFIVDRQEGGGGMVERVSFAAPAQ